MNYIELVRAFWRSQEEHSFSPTEVALYFYLLEVCNICRWKNPFRRNNAKIEADLSMTFYALKNARNKLKSTGLIDFKTTSGSPNVTYTLKMIYEVDDEVGNEVLYEVCNEVADKVLPTKDKLNKTKQNRLSHSRTRARRTGETSEKVSGASLSPPGCATPPAEATVPVVRLREEFNRRGETFALLVINALRGAGKLSQADVWNGLDRFTQELRARGEETKTARDYQSHFVNWLKIQLEKQHRNGNNQTGGTAGGDNGLTANERRYGSTRAAKQSIERRLDRLSAKVKAGVR
ncbi:MAG: hypothetical protein K2K83_05975 [Rikenella sp.]|nr:hypothetical protein [Rikenella sp.]